MKKSLFRIERMDCASEEQMIRMRLEGVKTIKSLRFDLPNRELEVYHIGDAKEILLLIENLRLGASIIRTDNDSEIQFSADQTLERKLLIQVLAINLFFFALEMVAGFISGSMGLVADSLDMLADSLVYGLSLIAVGGVITRKKNIARASGYFQLFLAILGFAEVIRRFIWNEPVPVFQTMIVISIFALIGNTLSLYLLQRSRSNEAHMQASMIFTSNDVIANIGVIVAGILVYLTGSKYPDLIVGSIVFVLVGIGAYRIMQLSK